MYYYALIKLPCSPLLCGTTVDNIKRSYNIVCIITLKNLYCPMKIMEKLFHRFTGTFISAPIRCWLGVASLVMATASVAHAAEHYWTGAVDGDFNNAGNWTPTAAVSGNDTWLYFGESDQYNVVSDGGNFNIRRLIFQDTAEQAYTLSGTRYYAGSGLHAYLRITNESAFTHTIANGIHFSPVIVAFHSLERGGFVWTGSSSNTGGTLRKIGLAKMTIRDGNHNNAGTSRISSLQLFGGELELDFNSSLDLGSVAGLMFQTTYEGTENNAGYNPTAMLGSTLRILANSSGATNVSLGNVTFTSTGWAGHASGAGHRIILDSNGGAGLTLALGSIAGTTNSTLNIRLLGDSSVTATSLATTNGVSRRATVTSGGITGFAILDGTDLKRVDTSTLTNLPTSGLDTTTNYRIAATDSASITITQNLLINTLTIQRSGSLNNSATSAYLDFGALLIEEGVGDFWLNTRYRDNRPDAGNNVGYIHHYGDGILYINAGVGYSGGPHTEMVVHKAGTGTVVVTDAAHSNGLGRLAIHEGRWITHSSMTGLSSVNVSNGGVLGGTATVGGASTGGYNANGQNGIHFHAGSMLDAGHNLDDSKGLTLVGAVAFAPQSIFAMTIGAADGSTTYTPVHFQRASGTGNLLIDGDLLLTLDNYDPEIGDIITLLTWSSDVTRVGTFRYANGQKIESNLLYVDFYEFAITYDDSGRSVYLTMIAVPEPTTVALLAGLALAGLVWVRRRK